MDLQPIQTSLQLGHIGLQLINSLLPHLSLERPRLLAVYDIRSMVAVLLGGQEVIEKLALERHLSK